MKRCLHILLAAFVCMVVFGANPQAEIKFSTTVHNFGTFNEDDCPVSCAFKFKNTGTAPLIINQAIASCGCTVPSFPEKPIAPGDSGVIKITYNGLGYYPGTFKKVITVMTNAKTRMMRLYIEGNMKARTATKK